MTETSAGTDRTAAQLLREASQLVEQVLIRLDMRKTECGECGGAHYAYPEHARLYQQFTDTPDKMLRAAALLESDPAALRARQTRSTVDRVLKSAKR